MARLLKSKGKSLSLGIVLASASSLSWAAPIYGSPDTAVAQETLGNSGQATETSWAKLQTGEDLTYIGKIEFENPGKDWKADGNTLYLDLMDLDVDYFIVKLGKGKGKNSKEIVSHHLFQNTTSTQYAVVDFSGIAGFNVGKISHIAMFEGPSVSVPEPSALALAGLGLAGLVVARRRRNRSL